MVDHDSSTRRASARADQREWEWDNPRCPLCEEHHPPDECASGRPHPQCWTGHHYEHDTCLRPSGKTCIEDGCDRDAGTLWGPHWCPVCDVERLGRVSAGLRDLRRSLTAREHTDG